MFKKMNEKFKNIDREQYQNHAEVSNLSPAGCMQLRMAVNAAQHKIVNFLKTL